MYSFFYVIEYSSKNPTTQTARVSRIKELAQQYQLQVYCETHEDFVTLQVETDNSESAVIFKLAAESALAESNVKTYLR